MLRALITVALVLGSGASPEQAKVKPAASKSPDRPFASDSQPSPDFDEHAEQRLLDMANQARAEAGAPPLQFDEGLIQAAMLELMPDPPLTRDQVRLLKTDKVVSGREPTLGDLGVHPTPLRDFLPVLKGKYGASADPSPGRG